MHSIRIRMLTGLAVLFLVSSLAIIGFTYMRTHNQVRAVYDAHLTRAAHLLLAMAAHEAEEHATKGYVAASEEEMADELTKFRSLLFNNAYAPQLTFQLWDDGKLVLRTPDSIDKALTDGKGLSYRLIGNELWRVYAVALPKYHLEVQVGEPYALRDAMVNAIARQSIYPILIALPLLGIAMWISIGRGLRPLCQMAREVALRSPEQLQPVAPEEAPAEIRPLIHSLNDLMGRLEETLARERRFTADASHELRTPLASLKTQTQVALRTNDPGAQEHALRQVLNGVDRATHLVDQLLTLARLDPTAADTHAEVVDLGRLTAEVLSDCAPAALERGIDLTLDEAETVTVAGNPAGLSILVRNLVGNAVNYTPEDGRVEVHLSMRENKALLHVDDSGPGIPPRERTRVFDRFFRGEGAKAVGCGLGLSIVRRVVQLHHASITLGDSPLGGLRVEVSLSTAAAGSAT